MTQQIAAGLADLAKIHFTLEELEEMNRDMESIVKLMDYIKEVQLPPETPVKNASNIIYLRPDARRGNFDPPAEGEYFKIPRIIE
jgi:Asp-tRNA(Asn)/Glu-tRNA(Gln) amidotransferase C subunit